MCSSASLCYLIAFVRWWSGFVCHYVIRNPMWFDLNHPRLYICRTRCSRSGDRAVFGPFKSGIRSNRLYHCPQSTHSTSTQSECTLLKSIFFFFALLIISELNATNQRNRWIWPTLRFFSCWENKSSSKSNKDPVVSLCFIRFRLNAKIAANGWSAVFGLGCRWRLPWAYGPGMFDVWCN